MHSINENRMKQPAIIIPDGLIAPDGQPQPRLLLHACCAPCSSAIVEWLMAHQIQPVIYYYNPNIYPREEYEIRKNESKRHADSLGIQWLDDDWRHTQWLSECATLKDEPERGKRCKLCFYHRLLATAQKAQQLGITYFGTTLASSRWKNLEQVNAAGIAACQTLNDNHQGQPAPEPNTPHGQPAPEPNTPHGQPGGEPLAFWAQNWRKDGLQERRNQLLKEYHFYNQLYCGCEFSMPKEK